MKLVLTASMATFVLAARAGSQALLPPLPLEWRAYGNDPGGARFSSATAITPDNVQALRIAWIARTGDYMTDRGRFEATPILVDGTLYVSTPLGSVLALDPATGTERWRRQGPVRFGYDDYGDFANRGVAAWTSGAGGERCAIRVFVATVNARLVALDGRSGRPCATFGDQGTIDLTVGLRHQPDHAWEYGVTSPPIVVHDLVIVGSRVADNRRTDAPEGVIRAFDVRTGALRWTFDPIPRQATEPGYDTWIGPTAHNTGAANAWSVFSADPARDLLFVPVGSASPDFYGGERRGDNRHSSSVVALRASSGALVWAFQVVHHDIWDYDVPAQPVLFTLRRGRDTLPAVAVATKMGHVFILDRRTGAPLVPVEERPVPPSDVPGEEAAPTQPFPPPAFRLAPESLTAADGFGLTDSARSACRARIASLRFQGVFTPPSLQGTIIWPGNIGGMNWSGVSVDEARGILVAPTNRLATVVRLIPRDSLPAAYAARPNLEYGRQLGTPYAMSRDDLRICTPPPWGALTALDLNAGQVKWQVPLGVFPRLAAVPGAGAWGSVNLGGALLTASGLIFIAGTFDQRLRAFELETGRELWSAALPAAAHALPMTYVVAGRQYVVIAAGGHDRLHTPMGDYVLAFTLPGPGTPVPDTAPASPGALAGEWVGEIRIGDARGGMRLALHPLADSFTASAQLDSVTIIGPVTARRSGRGVTIAFPFRYPAKHDCTATLTTTLALWNGGRLLEGGGAVDGPCADHGHQDAAFLFRRPDARSP
ncbi:MAG TPA: pyrroloquinoline quinone-dependent dehydrogenase [Gemmatimonadales bacterium]|nr:pyrroloquinoline quinone-dependent dehydrogenase [Gemmatimonadales bacterium]